VRAAKGCSQGGVLSPLSWSLVVNDLLEKQNTGGYHTQAYADDIVVLISGKFLETITNLSNSALKIINQLCLDRKLGISASKTTSIAFTRRRRLDDLGPIKIAGNNIPLSQQVKFLGIHLDSKLT